MIPFIIKDMCAVLYSSIAQLSQKKKKKKWIYIWDLLT